MSFFLHFLCDKGGRALLDVLQYICFPHKKYFVFVLGLNHDNYLLRKNDLYWAFLKVKFLADVFYFTFHMLTLKMSFFFKTISLMMCIFFSSQFDALASWNITKFREKEVGKDFIIGRLFEEMNWRRFPLLLSLHSGLRSRK